MDNNMKLPTVKGRNLERQTMVFPDDFTAEINLVFIAFLRRHQDLIDTWVPFVEKLLQENPHIDYYEFPTLPEGGFMYRMFLNEGMRAGIPNQATRTRTITLYLDKQVFRKKLDIPNEQSMWIYLFDKSGNVLSRVEGQITDEKKVALTTAIKTLTNEMIMPV
jgi:hypothetical protein